MGRNAVEEQELSHAVTSCCLRGPSARIMWVAEHISYRVDGPIAYVALARPEKLNGLTLEMMDDLVDAARRIRRDRDIRAVILSGEGTSFCTGLDFASASRNPLKVARSFVPIPSWLPVFGRGTNLFQRCCWVWRELPVPVLAVIEGHCFGAGMQLALAADFRFATQDCEFSIMEARWGLIPDMSGTATLRELVGIDTAKALTMTGAVIGAVEAAELGLITQATEEPLLDALALAAQIIDQSPDAVAEAKQLFNNAWAAGLMRAFARERWAQLRLLAGPNSRIARNARLNGTAPSYQQRQFS
jgi:enoyl-CoA hydratase/carnithine racemase